MVRQDELTAVLAQRKDPDDLLAGLDTKNPEHRRAVLAAVERLVIDRVLAAADCPPSRDRFDVFDLDAVAGVEISPLVLGFFDGRMVGLEKPDDQELTEAADYIGVKLVDPAHGDRFHRCWAANQAASAVLALLYFLDDALPAAPEELRAELEDERRRIAALRALGPPFRVDSMLASAEDRYARFIGPRI